MKRSLAEQREEEYENESESKLRLTGWHLVPWAVSALLGMLAAFLKYVVPGYSFSALVCLCLVGVILFYTVTGLLKPAFPNVMRRLRGFFSVCLVLGLLVVGVTEYIIIEASHGTPDTQVEYMIVLGAKVRNDGPSVSLWDRIYAARDYMNAHPDVIAVLSGGQGADEPFSEAESMRYQLTKLGIDESRLLVEDRATSTWENMHFSLDLIEEETGTRPTKIGVLSSEYHLYRASLFAEACDVEFVGIPAATSRLSQKINHFMREVAGVWHYILLGGRYDA